MSVFGIKLIIFLSFATGYIPFLSGLILYRRLTKELRWLLYFITVGLIVDLVLLYLYVHRIHNLWLIHSFTLIEILFLGYIFYSWHVNSKIKMGISWTIYIYTVLWIVSKFFLEKFNSFDNFTASLSSILLTIMALLTLYCLTHNIEKFENNLFQVPIFWISISVLVSYTAAIFILFLSNRLPNWDFHNALSIMGNLIYTGGFLSVIRPKLSGQSSLEPQ